MSARPAAPVAVVSDTTGYLPRELVEESDIHLVSLRVNWEDGTERESDMASFDDFYGRLRAAEQLPTTSQPPIGFFRDVYEPLLAAGRDIVSIHISGGISGTVESARQAVEQIAGAEGRDHRCRLRNRLRRPRAGDACRCPRGTGRGGSFRGRRARP